MLRRLEVCAAAALAATLHAVFLLATPAPEGGASAAGGGGNSGEARVVVAGAEVQALVEAWTVAPGPQITPPQPEAQAPPALSEAATTWSTPDQAPLAALAELAGPPRPTPPATPPPPDQAMASPAAAPTPKPKPMPEPQPRRKANPSSQPSRSGAEGQRGAAGRVAADRDASGSGAAAASGAGSAPAGLLRAWGGQIRAEISRERKYPSAARRRRREGRVILRLTVSQAGDLLAATIAQASGSRRLDDAALAAALAAAPYAAAPAALTKPQYQFNIPIAFRLK